MPIIRISVERRPGSSLASAMVGGRSKIFTDDDSFSALSDALDWAAGVISKKQEVLQAINDAWDERMLVQKGETEDEDQWASNQEIVERVKKTPYLHVRLSPPEAKWSHSSDPIWDEPASLSSEKVRFQKAVKKIIASDDNGLLAMATAALEDIIDGR